MRCSTVCLSQSFEATYVGTDANLNWPGGIYAARLCSTTPVPHSPYYYFPPCPPPPYLQQMLAKTFHLA
jgi:hypothetical protein